MATPRFVAAGSQMLRILPRPAHLLASWDVSDVNNPANKVTGTVTYNDNELPTAVNYTDGSRDSYVYTMATDRVWTKCEKKTTDASGALIFSSTDTRVLDEQNRVIHREQIVPGSKSVYDYSYAHNSEGDCIHRETWDGEELRNSMDAVWFEPTQAYIIAEGNSTLRARVTIDADGLGYVLYNDNRNADPAQWKTSSLSILRFDAAGHQTGNGYVTYDSQSDEISYCYGSDYKLYANTPQEGWTTKDEYKLEREGNGYAWKLNGRTEQTDNWEDELKFPARGDRHYIHYNMDDNGNPVKDEERLEEWLPGNVLKCTKHDSYEDWVGYEKYAEAGEFMGDLYFNADGSYIVEKDIDEVGHNTMYYWFYSAQNVLLRQLREVDILNRFDSSSRMEEYKNGEWAPIANEVITIHYDSDSYETYTYDNQGRLVEHFEWEDGEFDSKKCYTYTDTGYIREVWRSADSQGNMLYLSGKEIYSLANGMADFEEIDYDYEGGITSRHRETFDEVEGIYTNYGWDEALQAYTISYQYAEDIRYVDPATGATVTISRELVDGKAVNYRKTENFAQGADNDPNDIESWYASYVWDGANNRWRGESKTYQKNAAAPQFDVIRPEDPITSVLFVPTDYINIALYPVFFVSDVRYLSSSINYSWDDNANDWVADFSAIEKAVVEGNTYTYNVVSENPYETQSSKQILTRDDEGRLIAERYEDVSFGNTNITDQSYTYDADGLLVSATSKGGDGQNVMGMTYDYHYMASTGIALIALTPHVTITGSTITSDGVLTLTDLAGRLVATGTTVKAPATGIYLLRTADGKSMKLRIKN